MAKKKMAQKKDGTKRGQEAISYWAKKMAQHRTKIRVIFAIIAAGIVFMVFQNMTGT